MAVDMFTSTEIDQTASTLASTLVASLERCWAMIREHHPDVPAVVLILGIGSEGRRRMTGHFAESRWTCPKPKRRGPPELRCEVMVAGELFEEGPTAILEVLLHEAAHARNFVQNIADVTRQGRYHNEHFAETARQLGLECSLERGSGVGWQTVGALPATLTQFAEALSLLEASHKAVHRMHRRDMTRQSGNAVAAAGEKLRPSRRVTLQCKCPSKIMCARDVAERRVVRCDACKTLFTRKKCDE